MTQVAVIDQVRDAITKMTPQFKAALPAHVSPEKFVRVVMTAIQMTPALLEADRRTLFSAAMRASQMGLLPDGREGAIVTFSGKAQFMPMVAGVMKLVRNSGEISTWSVQAIYANDEFEYELGDNERIIHKPKLGDRGKVIGAYSIVLMKDGERSREIMGVDEIEAIRKRSRSGGSGPWVTDFAEMAKKTVVRRHSKRLPMSTDLDEAMREDEELFAPAESVRQESQATVEPEAPRRRASRLDKVASQADDDVTDVMPNEPPVDTSEPTAGQTEDHDSPI